MCALWCKQKAISTCQSNIAAMFRIVALKFLGYRTDSVKVELIPNNFIFIKKRHQHFPARNNSVSVFGYTIIVHFIVS